MLSANKLAQLPPDSGHEVAFAGRSNAGKSSALNTLTRIRGLARTSKTPGRTQMINLFQLDEEHRLIDLPGYGYAKVPLAIKKHWEQVLEQYLLTRQSLSGLVLIMDIRHPLKPFDVQMVHWCAKVGMPLHVLLTKSDKLKRGAAQSALLKVKKELSVLMPEASVQLYSSLKGVGVEELSQQLDHWLGYQT